MTWLDGSDETHGDDAGDGVSSTATRRRQRRLRRWMVLAALLIAVLGWGAWRATHRLPASADQQPAAAAWYRCTMTECNDPGSGDPESRCPVCGMKREAVDIQPAANAWYRCTMTECNDPGSDNPESRCPVCNMKREPVEIATGSSGFEISLDDSARELATLATEPVVRRDLLRRIRAVGTITFDERRYVTVSARTAGTVESLSADFTGARVAAGDELLQIYSLELLNAQNELLRLIWGFGRIPGRGRNRSVDQDLVTARHKLELMGVTPREIDLLIEADHEDPYLAVRSPIGGTVIRKEVFAGQWIDRGDLLFEIADLSRLWLLLDLYEEELPWLRLGQTVTVATSSLPGEEFTGTVSFIDPVVDAESRTVKVRVELANRRGHLKPGMFVTAHVVATLAGYDAAGSLAVPREAVLETGERSLVYVESTPGTYRGVRVELGPQAEDASGRSYYPILSGVAEGERVVTRGGFVIDSQMQIANGPSLFDVGEPDAHQHDPGSPTPAAHAPAPSSPPSHRTDRRQTSRSEATDDLAGVEAQPTCPVLGNPSDPTVYIDYRGVRLYFCSHLCTPKFLAAPESYTPKLPSKIRDRLIAAEARLRSELGS